MTPDGKRLFFTSDRDGGIYNIYSINLENGETNLHTNVVAGAFSPTVFIGKDNTEKLVFSAYYKRRFTLYIADAKKSVRRLPELAPAVSPAGPESEAPFQSAIEVSVDPEKIKPRASHKLQLEDAQVVAGVNTDQTFVSNTVLVFGDNLGDRRLIAQFQSLSSFTNFNFIYFNLTHRLQKGFALFDDRTFFLGINQATVYQEWGPLSGRRFALSYSYSPDFKKDENTMVPGQHDSGTLSSDVTVDIRRYFKITARSLLAIRFFGAHSTGNFPNVYYFGGLDTLRGLSFREQIGNTVGYANFEYRFPLIDILQTPLLAFRNIRGQVFVDVGGAALKDQRFVFWEKDPNGGGRHLKDGRASYGMGFQLSLLGLDLHWDFAKLWDFKKTLSGLKTSFYIGAQF